MSEVPVMARKRICSTLQWYVDAAAGVEQRADAEQIRAELRALLSLARGADAAVAGLGWGKMQAARDRLRKVSAKARR